ncbi:MAG: hypothetical protein GX958_11300 [Desulfitobacterium sp.]|nr:hypothetical protein [Desulfitobacterium sp.]
MSSQNDFQTLHDAIKKVGKLEQHNISIEVNFSALKEQILVVLKSLFGDTSREYRVVKLTNSPATVVKVMNHIAARTNHFMSKNTAVNI